MPITKTDITSYFQETLAVDVAPEIWQPGRRLPLFLRDGYTFYEIQLLGNRCLLMADKEPDRSAAAIRKHIQQVQPKWEGDIIYVRNTANSDERRRLIEQKIPFVVPGNQMYLPTLGIDLREHFRRVHGEVTMFSPAAQAAILLLLTDAEPHTYDAQQLADRLDYSKMTASRTLNELKSEDLGIIQLEGRARRLEFNNDRRGLWERTLPLLSSPVKHRQHIRCAPDSSGERKFGPEAGLTALARYSMLAAPPTPTVAVTSERWKAIEAQPTVTSANPADPETIEVEVWSYDPLLFAKDGTCDPFSVFLSLNDNEDERVQSALQEMMEAVS